MADLGITDRRVLGGHVPQHGEVVAAPGLPQMGLQLDHAEQKPISRRQRHEFSHAPRSARFAELPIMMSLAFRPAPFRAPPA